MTQYDAEILAQFVSTWSLLKHNDSLRAALKVDLSNFLADYALDFDRQAYWAFADKIATPNPKE